MENYYTEGSLIGTPENKACLRTPAAMQEAMLKGRILEARAAVCDSEHNLHVDLPCMKGIIPRIEGAMGIEDGSTRDIALIAKVNKPVCFKILNITQDPSGAPLAVLSRRAVQQSCMKDYISALRPGDVIPAKVTHMEQFGCFVDVGCGLPSLIPIDAISVSRISHPSDRFFVGQNVRVVIKGVQNGRIWLSHKELLGTWEENASLFHCGETVSGVVRSVENYGVFVELAPNLAGLAEVRDNVHPGQQASVYIKAVIPEKMKVKLIIVDVFDAGYPVRDLHYFTDARHISRWTYSTPQSEKKMESVFEGAVPPLPTSPQ